MLINKLNDSEIELELIKKINIWKKFVSDDNLKLPDNIIKIIKHFGYGQPYMQIITDDNIEKLKLTQYNIKNIKVQIKNTDNWIPILVNSTGGKFDYYYINTDQQKCISYCLVIHCHYPGMDVEVYDLHSVLSSEQ